jgi:hypothetical protein
LVGVVSGASAATATAIALSEIRRVLGSVRERAVFSISNQTGNPIHFKVRLDADREWQSLSLQANKYHSWWPDKVGAIEVEFDYSFAAGYQPKSYSLPSRRVLIGTWQGRTPWANYGSQYLFRGVDGGIDLFTE